MKVRLEQSKDPWMIRHFGLVFGVAAALTVLFWATVLLIAWRAVG